MNTFIFKNTFPKQAQNEIIIISLIVSSGLTGHIFKYCSSVTSRTVLRQFTVNIAALEIFYLLSGERASSTTMSHVLNGLLWCSDWTFLVR